MFHTRITEAWGAPASLRERYMLERKVELSSGIFLLCGRERASGVRRWLKFSSTPAEMNALAQEAAALAACTHPHLARITERNEDDEDHAWFALEWQAETPLDEEMLQRLPAIDRLRLAPALVNVVEALAEQQIAVPELNRKHLWISPSLHWLRLTGLPGAETKAKQEAIGQMRISATRLMNELAVWNATGQGETELQELASNWCNGEKRALDALQSELDRALLMAVTADL